MVDDLPTGEPEDLAAALEEGESGPGLPTPPMTGDPAVDAAAASLSDVVRQPLEAQPAGYESVHRTLTDRLADLEG